ncbi:MAG: hypothetical protein KatS3mg001_058 [Candidatus Pacearchaeota archaeon]|nr:MAG: hypothetical protein KatS3mg001_058 [Candidatus Pacearchaeota archaeon]
MKKIYGIHADTQGKYEARNFLEKKILPPTARRVGFRKKQSMIL